MWKTQGATRLLLIPDIGNGELRKVLIGHCTPQQEHMITILKTAQLLKECERVCPTHQTKKTVKIINPTGMSVL